MLGIVALAALLAGTPEAAERRPSIQPAAFTQWFDLAVDKGLTIPDPVRENASRYRYVFVSGLTFGMMQGYFQQNVKELRAQGVPRDAIHIIQPSSSNTIEQNAQFVREEIQAIAAKGPGKLVLIAHSRGACDALAFALKNPTFVKNRVAALFLIQGPFGGTGVADYVSGEGEPMDGQMPRVYRMLGKTIGRLEEKLLSDGRHDAIAALSRQASVEFWDRLLHENRKAVPIVAPRTFYITSRTGPSHHPVMQRASAWYLGTYYGPNDGLVTLEDQSIPGLGTVLVVLDAGHSDLTRRFPAARPRGQLRRALVDAILMAVGTKETRDHAKTDAAALRAGNAASGRGH